MKKCKPRRRHMQTTHSQDAAEILPLWSRHHGPMLARIQANEIKTELLGINSNCCVSSHIYCLSSIQYAIHFPSMFMWFHTWFCTHPNNISNREKEKVQIIIFLLYFIVVQNLLIVVCESQRMMNTLFYLISPFTLNLWLQTFYWR